MKTLMRIFAVTFENYAIHEGGEFWKNKGLQEFELEMDLDVLMYAKDQTIEAIKQLLAEHSNKYMKFEFKSVDPVFHKAIKLDGDKCLQLIQAMPHGE